jgi:hypothetical protein
VFAIWEPIRTTDFSSPGGGARQRLLDARVTQYWDEDHLFAKELALRLDANPNDANPDCCVGRGFNWDELIVYPKDARWDKKLPGALFIDGPIVRALAPAKSAMK